MTDPKTEAIISVEGESETSPRRPASRIRDVLTAKATFNKFKQNMSAQARDWAKLQGLIDGNRPYNPADLERLGQSWRANVNYREAEAILDISAATYWELLMEVPALIDVTFRPDPKRKPENEPAVDYGQIIAEEYTTTLQEWDSFYFTMCMATKEMLTFGPGVIWWKNEYDWRFESPKSFSVLTNRKAKCDIEKQKIVCIRDEMEVDEIWSKLADPENVEDDATWQARSAEEGWDITELKAALIRVFKKGQQSNEDPYQLGEWGNVQMEIRNNDYAANETDFDGLKIVHMLVKECDGKISHYVFAEDFETKNFLFKKQRRYEKFSGAMCMFFYEIGDGFYNSVRGLAHRFFSIIELSNRFINSTLDGAMVSGSLVLQNAGSQATDDEIRVVRMGPITLLPDNFNPIQTSFTPDLNKMVSVREMLHRILNNNFGVYRTQRESGDQPEKTAAQVVSEQKHEARFEKNRVSMYYVQADRLHRETARRLARKDYKADEPGYEEHKAFMDRCKARGVPDKLMDPKNWRVRARRTIGYGSPVIKSMVTNELMQKLPLFDQIGQVNIKRDWLGERVGWTNVERYAPVGNRDMIAVNETSIAMLETNDFVEGGEAVVGTDQNHVIHGMVHASRLMQMAQAYVQNPEQADIEKIRIALTTGIPHLSEHVKILSRDPSKKEQTKQLDYVLGNVIQIYRKVEKEFQKQMEARQKKMQEQAALIEQAKQQVQSTEMQEKLAKLRGELEIEMFKQQNMAKIREMKAVHAMRLNDIETAAKLRREASIAVSQTGGEATGGG